jgi:hypothetical protein
MNAAKILAVALAALSLGGCIFFDSPRAHAMRNDPTFKAGYGDGCASANASGTNYRTGGLVKDDSLYKASQPYRSGWGAGYSTCSRQNTPNGPDPSMGGMPAQKPPGTL